MGPDGPGADGLLDKSAGEVELPEAVCPFEVGEEDGFPASLTEEGSSCRSAVDVLAGLREEPEEAAHVTGVVV